MRKRGTKIAGVLFALLVVSGCSGSVDGPVIEGDRRTGGTDALVVGELVVEPGCLYLYQPDDGDRFPVIWPHRTSWDADQSAVVLPGGVLVHEGDSLSGGGGYHKDNLDRFTVPEGVELALACVDNEFGEIAVFNSPGPLDVQR